MWTNSFALPRHFLEDPTPFYTFIKHPLLILYHPILLILPQSSDWHIYGESDAILAAYKRWLAAGLSRRGMPRHADRPSPDHTNSTL